MRKIGLSDNRVSGNRASDNRVLVVQGRRFMNWTDKRAIEYFKLKIFASLFKKLSGNLPDESKIKTKPLSVNLIPSCQTRYFMV